MPKTFSNNPVFKNESNDGMVKRYSHQPLTLEHNGIHVTIKENGRVKIVSEGREIPGTDDIEYDEVEIPASLIFKISSALRMTRTVKFIPVNKEEE